jgi:hypothetical protein
MHALILSEPANESRGDVLRVGCCALRSGSLLVSWGPDDLGSSRTGQL